MKRAKMFVLSCLLIFLSCPAFSQDQQNWNLTEQQVDSIMLQKGFHYIRESHVNGRHMKLYAGLASVFGIQFDAIGYSWNKITMPMGGIETIIFTQRINGISDSALRNLRDVLTSKYGYPECDENTLTCEWKFGGKVTAVMQFSGNNMNLFLINPSAIGW